MDEATPKLCSHGLWALVASVVPVVAFVEDSRASRVDVVEVVFEVVLAAAVAVAAVSVVVAAVVISETVVVIEMAATEHPAALHLAPVQIVEMATEEIEEPLVGMNLGVVRAHTTTDTAAAAAAAAVVVATAMAVDMAIVIIAVLEATWSRSDVEKVGIEIETTIDHETTTAAESAATTVVVTRILESCDDTKPAKNLHQISCFSGLWHTTFVPPLGLTFISSERQAPPFQWIEHPQLSIYAT